MVSTEPIYETWYVMEDGTYGDPREIGLKDGGLAHGKSGLKVAMRNASTPRARGVEVDANGKLIEEQPKPANEPFGGKGDHDNNGKVGGAAPAKATAEMKPEPASAPKAKKPYRTR